LWPAGVGEPAWQGESCRPRIFAYLRPNLPGFPAVIQALAALDGDGNRDSDAALAAIADRCVELAAG
jgi:hypothetical protein